VGLPPPFGTQCIEPSPGSLVCMCTTHSKSPPSKNTPDTSRNVCCTSIDVHTLLRGYREVNMVRTHGYQWYCRFRMILNDLWYGYSIPGCRYSVQQYGCSVAKADPQYTHIKPYIQPSTANITWHTTHQSLHTVTSFHNNHFYHCYHHHHTPHLSSCPLPTTHYHTMNAFLNGTQVWYWDVNGTVEHGTV
jgi:hypothetical protein